MYVVILHHSGSLNSLSYYTLATMLQMTDKSKHRRCLPMSTILAHQPMVAITVDLETRH